MLNDRALEERAQKERIDRYSILREYLQVAFLNTWYEDQELIKTYFKGGTALRLLFASGRFSEDLDFNTTLGKHTIEKHLERTVAKLSREFSSLSWKPLDSLQGVSAKLVYISSVATQPLTIKLDFSLRENVLDPQRRTMETDYPIATFSVIPHLSLEEILAEKLHAVLHREKGRDVYDIFFLLSRNVSLNKALIQKKFAFFHEKFSLEAIRRRIKHADIKELASDLARFLPKPARSIIPSLPALVLEKLERLPFV